MLKFQSIPATGKSTSTWGWHLPFQSLLTILIINTPLLRITQNLFTNQITSKTHDSNYPNHNKNYLKNCKIGHPNGQIVRKHRKKMETLINPSACFHNPIGNTLRLDGINIDVKSTIPILQITIKNNSTPKNSNWKKQTKTLKTLIKVLTFLHNPIGITLRQIDGW